ncbi:AN1-type zinc finger protein 2A isoform X3 [Tursiops truncatus]|uniref:AN1-type zinc finger protein 2A isoform X3 n=1 Tax=Tursiops truncatus TaxID=9739 RepID=UPI003CCF4F38
MEFPDLGKHCSEKTCNQLDFLPLECDACKQDFCKDHFTCAAHKCPFAFKKDVQVPVCPLCNSPIPVKTGEVPDVVVGEHMDGACKHHPGKKKEKNFRRNRSRHLWSLLHPQLQSKETRVGHGPWQLVHSSDWRLSEPCTRPQAQPSTARSLGPPGLFGWFP